MTVMMRNVYAKRDFRDSDGVAIQKGQHLGDLCAGGTNNARTQSYWTQKDGFVTACFQGHHAEYITLQAPAGAA